MTLFDEAHERRVAWRLVLAVLVTLTAVKPLGGIPYVGTLAFTIAAAMQLYLPLWRIDTLRQPYAFLGLTLRHWREDARGVLLLAALTFPPYVVGYHLYMTAGHDALLAWGWFDLAHYFPRYLLAPHWPSDALAWLKGSAWLGEIVLTHTLGVALPEETFYRGYLQPRLETLWRPQRRFLGTPVGYAALLTAFLFAAGHFLGEWNPLRWGPFFPALIFAWQRNRTGTIVGAITYHASCNILSEILFSLYRPF